MVRIFRLDGLAAASVVCRPGHCLSPIVLAVDDQIELLLVEAEKSAGLLDRFSNVLDIRLLTCLY